MLFFAKQLSISIFLHLPIFYGFTCVYVLFQFTFKLSTFQILIFLILSNIHRNMYISFGEKKKEFSNNVLRMLWRYNCLPNDLKTVSKAILTKLMLKP